MSHNKETETEKDLEIPRVIQVEGREGRLVNDGRVKLISIREEKESLNRVAQLEKENAKLKQENNLLKKWQRFLGEHHQQNLDSSRETETLE